MSPVVIGQDMAKTLSWLRYVEFFMWRFMNHAALFGVFARLLASSFFFPHKDGDAEVAAAKGSASGS